MEDEMSIGEPTDPPQGLYDNIEKTKIEPENDEEDESEEEEDEDVKFLLENEVTPDKSNGTPLPFGRKSFFRAASNSSLASNSPQRFQMKSGVPSQIQQSSMMMNVENAALLGSQQRSVFDIDIDALEDKPWRKPGADITDYFNYGFVEETWKSYCQKQVQLRLEQSMQGKIRVYESKQQDQKQELPPELQAVALTGSEDTGTDKLKAPPFSAQPLKRTSAALPPQPRKTESWNRPMASNVGRRPREQDDSVIQVLASGEETPQPPAHPVPGMQEMPKMEGPFMMPRPDGTMPPAFDPAMMRGFPPPPPQFDPRFFPPMRPPLLPFDTFKGFPPPPLSGPPPRRGGGRPPNREDKPPGSERDQPKSGSSRDDERGRGPSDSRRSPSRESSDSRRGGPSSSSRYGSSTRSDERDSRRDHSSSSSGSTKRSSSGSSSSGTKRDEGGDRKRSRNS